MGSSGSSSSGDQTHTVQYAPYIEERHAAFLAVVVSDRQAIISDDPFAGYVNIDAGVAFFGLGVSLSNLPPLFTCFGAVANLDIDRIWDTVLNHLLTRQEINDSVVTAVQEIDAAVVEETLPNFAVDMRNLNAVCSSSFIVGRSVIEDARIKQAALVRLSVKSESLKDIPDVFAATLNSKSEIVKRYAALIKEYFVWKLDTDAANYTMASRSALWPFTVLSFEGMALGTMQNMKSWQKAMEKRERSTVSKVLLVASYTATGAYIGSSVPVVGTIIGGAVGFVIGVAAVLFG